MFICFVYSGRGSPQPLEIYRDANDGPFYPYIAETSAEKFHRFFAGKLTGLPPSATLPDDHPVLSNSAADWSFPEGEPDGSWIALKADLERDILSIAADIFNVQRWFYGLRDGRWYISNSLRYLFRAMPEAQIEWRAVPYLLHHGYLPRRLTPLKEVYELDVGEVLTVEHGAGRITRRGELPVHRRLVMESGDYSQAVADVIREAVANEIGSLDQLVVPISGGMDSRFLLGCALQVLSREKISTVTFGSPSSMDLKIGTALARKLGVINIPLPMDDRRLCELLHDNFATAEGMYWTVPDYPVAPFRGALPPQSYVLSGYIGDPVFGSKEGKASLTQPVEGNEQHVITLLRSAGAVVPWDVVQPVLADPKRDPLNLEREVLDLPGKSMQERHDFWYFGTHTTNRTHYAVTPARAHAFYLMPFIHRHVLDVAFALPEQQRLEQKAFYAAMKLRVPELYRFPTKRNYGFPIDRKSGPDMLTVRSWRKLWSTVDEKFGPSLNRIIYRHPRYNYDHPRELGTKKNQPDVLAALDDLKSVPALNPAALEKIRSGYLTGAFDAGLLRGLLTVHQWTLHYK